MKVLNVKPQPDNQGMLWYVEYIAEEENGLKNVQECFTDQKLALDRIKYLQKRLGKWIKTR